MDKKKKDGKNLNCVIDRTVFQMLESYCDELGQTKTLAVERILKQHLTEYYKNKPVSDMQ